MPKVLTSGTQCQCSFGAAPSTLVARPGVAQSTALPVLTVDQIAPTTNIPPFGMCSSLANPQVAAATSAAAGVLTPQPCIPAITGPWAPGSSNHHVMGNAAATEASRCVCNWGGVISVVSTPNIALDAA